MEVGHSYAVGDSNLCALFWNVATAQYAISPLRRAFLCIEIIPLLPYH